jgi:NAD(P)H-dependent FMN reductase
VLLAPERISIRLYRNLAAIPPFNPDREAELYDMSAGYPRYRDGLTDSGLAAVKGLGERVREADGLLIACPEYARGVPGAFKNALDWLVGGDVFVSKPFALFNASPRATHAQTSLRVTLETMSGRLIEKACLTLPVSGSGWDAAGIAADAAFARPIREALAAFLAALPPESGTASI